MKMTTNMNLEKSKEGFRMTKRKIWIILFIIGIVMILGASEFSRFLANEINWYTAGIISVSYTHLATICNFRAYHNNPGNPCKTGHSGAKQGETKQ